MNASIIKSQQKIQKSKAKLSKMKDQHDEIHLNMEDEEIKLNAESVKQEAMLLKLIEKNNNKTARQEQAQQKAKELKAKRDINNYIATKDQVIGLASFKNECLIRMTNSLDPEIAISLVNLFRVHAHRLQELYPEGWTVPIFKSTFKMVFADLDWFKKLKHPEESIGTVYYRMCPDSQRSISKTGKLTAIPSFKKVEDYSRSKIKYIFDANLYLTYLILI